MFPGRLRGAEPERRRRRIGIHPVLNLSNNHFSIVITLPDSEIHMNRRDVLVGICGLSTASIAGCTGFLETENSPTEVTTSEARQAQQAATQAPPRNAQDFDREFLIDAFRIELVRNSIQPNGLSVDSDSGTVLLKYDTKSPITDDEAYTAGLLGEFLTISNVFYRELLRPGFETDSLQVWAQRDDITKVYDMRSEWVRDRVNARITDAQFLTYVTQSVQNIGE